MFYRKINYLNLVKYFVFNFICNIEIFIVQTITTLLFIRSLLREEKQILLFTHKKLNFLTLYYALKKLSELNLLPFILKVFYKFIVELLLFL